MVKWSADFVEEVLGSVPVTSKLFFKRTCRSKF